MASGLNFSGSAGEAAIVT